MIYRLYNMYPCKDVPFVGCIDTAPQLGVKSTKTSILEEV